MELLLQFLYRFLAQSGFSFKDILLQFLYRVLAQSGLSFKDQIPGGSGKPITLGEALMAPTVNYVQQVSPSHNTYLSIIKYNEESLVHADYCY